MLRRKNFLFCFVLLLLVLPLVFSGCSGGGSNTGGGNGGGNDDDDYDFSAYMGTWKSVGVTPAVEITVGSKIGGGDSYLYFTGKVTCNIFRLGNLIIAESDNDILGDKYILAHKVTVGDMTVCSIHVMAREEYEDELLGTLANELSLDGFLADANTLRVDSLHISSQDPEFSYDFESEGEGDYLIFDKQ